MARGGQSSDPEKRQRQLANLKRGGTTAPAGNDRAVTHGAYAAVLAGELETKTKDIFGALAADAPVRAADGGLPSHDTLVVRMLAEVMVRRERVRVEELKHGFEAKDGKLRGVVEYGLRLDGQALDLAKELGMTPASRAKLGLDLARTHRTLEDDVQGAGDLWAQPAAGDVIEGTAVDDPEKGRQS